MTARIFYASFAAAIFLGFFGHLYTATACFVVTNVALLVAVREGRVHRETGEHDGRGTGGEARHRREVAVESVADADEREGFGDRHPDDEASEPAAHLSADVRPLGHDDDQHDRDGLGDDLTLLGSDLHRTDATDGGGVA